MTKQYQRGTAVVRPVRRPAGRVVRRHPALRVAAPAPVVAVPPPMTAPMVGAAPPVGAGGPVPPEGPPPGMIPGYKKGTASVKHKGHEKLHDNRHVAAAGHFPIQEHAKIHMGRHVTQIKEKK